MFSFHKPKVYRSTTGCCICRAKSSSSRFTDSKKYEDDFMECFQLKERRTGEICNACVLLVKRWKKLPEGSERNWRHVVDARAGPGTKSLTKFKSKNKKLKQKLETAQKNDKLIKKKHTYVKNDRVREHSPGALSDDITGEDFLSDLSGPSMPPSLATSPVSFEHPANGKKNSIKMEVDTCEDSNPEVSSFVDMTYWKREKVCCGTIFKGPYGDVIIDPRFLKPCSACIAPNRTVERYAQPSMEIVSVEPMIELPSSKPTIEKTNAVPAMKLALLEDKINRSASQGKSLGVIKSFSDSSSDSGYDESSNPGVVDANHTRSDNIVTNPLADFAMHATNQCLQVPAPAN